MYGILNSFDTWENINDTLKESQSNNGQGLCCKQKRKAFWGW